MKKKNLLMLAVGVVGLLAVARFVYASTVVYSKYLVNETALAINNKYVLDLRTAGVNSRSIDTVAATSLISSATVPTVSFTDGHVSTGSITVASTNSLVGAQATDSITVVTTQTMVNARLFVTGSNGVPVRLRQGYDWLIDKTTLCSGTATNIATKINQIAGIQANASGCVISATATAQGSAGNSFTITESGVDSSTLTIASANFTGGTDPATVTVNGTKLVFGVDIATTSVGTSTGAAQAISNAIMAKSALSSVLSSTWTAGGVVTATSSLAGVNAFSLAATPSSSLTVSGTAFTGGVNLSWVFNGSTINVPNHGLSTGLPVLYSTGVVAIGGLTNQTTFFAIVKDVNNFQLADTSTNAVAGNPLVLTSSTTTGGHTYTLATLATAGTFSYKWQISDDNVTWTDMAVSSVSFSTPFTSTTTAWDFGTVNHRYIRVNELAGSAGGVALQIAVTGKNSN